MAVKARAVCTLTRVDDGAAGKGIKSIVEQWYLSNSSTATSGGAWVSSRPAYQAGGYYWTRQYITYDDGSTAYAPSSAGVYNAAITQACADALTAKTDIEDTRQWFWHDSDGAHISTDKGSTSGPNTLLTAAGLHIRDGATDLASFTRDGAQIGKDGSWHLGVESDGFSIYEGANRRYHVLSFSDTDPVESGAYMDSGDSRLQMYHSETTGSHTELLTTATNDTAITSMRATETNYGTEFSKAAEVNKSWFGVTGDGDSDDSSSIDLSFGTESAHHVFGVDNAGNVVADGSLTASNSATYRLVEGGGPSYVWMDCRDSSNTVQNNMVLASAYTAFGKTIRAPGFTISGETLMKLTTVTLSFTAKKGTGTTGNVSVGTIKNYICAGIVQILSNHPNLLQLGQYFISDGKLYLTAYNHTTSDKSATYKVSLLWLHYGTY